MERNATWPRLQKKSERWVSDFRLLRTVSYRVIQRKLSLIFDAQPRCDEGDTLKACKPPCTIFSRRRARRGCACRFNGIDWVWSKSPFGQTHRRTSGPAGQHRLTEKKERKKGGRRKRSRASEKIATERERSSVRNSILVKRGYKAETGVNSDRRNRYLFNARRKKGGDRRREKDERRRLEKREREGERRKLSIGLRERVFHSARREEIKREIKKNRWIKKKIFFNVMLETQSVKLAGWRDRTRGNIRVADKT